MALLRSTEWEKEMETEAEDGDELVLEVAKKVNGSCRGLWQLKQGCVQFLRCSSLFIKYLTYKNEPGELAVLGGDAFDNLIR